MAMRGYQKRPCNDNIVIDNIIIGSGIITVRKQSECPAILILLSTFLTYQAEIPLCQTRF